MNKGFNEDNIKKRVASLGRECDRNYLYTTVQSGPLSFIMLGAYSALTAEYNIAVFYPEEILILPLSMAGNFKDEHYTIKKKDIELFTVKKGWLAYKLKMKLKETNLTLTVNKKVLGGQWQKGNIDYLESKQWFGYEEKI